MDLSGLPLTPPGDGRRRREREATPGRSLKPAASAITAPRAKVGRNDPCPCGSGKKYKKCCGA